jgi:hypothetical protein
MLWQANGSRQARVARNCLFRYSGRLQPSTCRPKGRRYGISRAERVAGSADSVFEVRGLSVNPEGKTADRKSGGLRYSCSVATRKPFWLLTSDFRILAQPGYQGRKPLASKLPLVRRLPAPHRQKLSMLSNPFVVSWLQAHFFRAGRTRRKKTCALTPWRRALQRRSAPTRSGEFPAFARFEASKAGVWEGDLCSDVPLRSFGTRRVASGRAPDLV